MTVTQKFEGFWLQSTSESLHRAVASGDDQARREGPSGASGGGLVDYPPHDLQCHLYTGALVVTVGHCSAQHDTTATLTDSKSPFCASLSCAGKCHRGTAAAR
eukprot:30678-Eustigmatos_ZCMA.PRE.1